VKFVGPVKGDSTTNYAGETGHGVSRQASRSFTGFTGARRLASRTRKFGALNVFEDFSTPKCPPRDISLKTGVIIAVSRLS
jgi:hypothetical protein